MERCHCCSARLKKATQCPRCQADLTAVIASEQFASYRLGQAIQYSLENKTELSIEALEHSLDLKKTGLAVVFRDFLIQQQCRVILDLLAQKKLDIARQSLNQIQWLQAHSHQLQQLHGFTVYLLAKNQDQSGLMQEY